MLEINNTMIRKKTDQQNLIKNKLNISKVKEFKHSITITKPNIKNNKKNTFKKNSNLKKFCSNKINSHSLLNDSRNTSLQFIRTQTQKYIDKTKIENEGCFDIKNTLASNLSSTKLNKIEINIKQKINNMKVKLNENNRKQRPIKIMSITPNKLRKLDFKLSSLKKKIKKKKKNSKNSVLIEDIYFETEIEDENIPKRSKSFCITENKKNKILKKINEKINKESNNKLDATGEDMENSISSDDDADNNEDLSGYSFSPNSNFIFIFDLIIIIMTLNSFISIPIYIARNKNIKELESSISGNIYYFVDLFFIFDLILSFFRGYYNYEFEIVRNNRKIIFHYLSGFFIFDLIEAIPIYSIVRLFIKKIDKIYYGFSEEKLKIFIPLLLIKPFKIFKNLRRKHNKALEDFYTYLSENYYLEKLAKFLIYFIVFFLFVHIFICLHIFFAFQSFPNWIDHINITNEAFFDKYITSLYFMVTTMTTVGYGDIICISHIERIYHIILLFIGTLFYTFLVSKIGNYLREESHEQNKLDKDLNILENLRITYPTMPFKLYTKIKSHLLSIFNKRKKTGVSLLINGIPDAIKNDLLFKIYSNVINGFKIFKNVENSNFIYQILTSFIPIISKKEEIIVLEGEMIQNIVFVKDGRLSIEIAIDINDPYTSIKKYAEINFIGISKQEEKKNYTLIGRLNSVKTKKNFNDLKTEINNILFDNKKLSLINNSINNNGISVDLGRMDFSRNDIEYNEKKNYQIIKILDIRKNEHYGDIHIFMEKPSPFTLKTKSRIGELLLLRKHDAVVISKNFPNIWRRIQNKSFHNLVSIKNLTFKILKQYYNTHLSNKNSRDKSVNLNLDITKNSVNDNSVAAKQSFTGAVAKINKDRSLNFSKQNDVNNNNNINKNKLHVKFRAKRGSKNLSNRKISEDTFGNELNYSYDSLKSNSITNSQFKFTISIMNDKKSEVSSKKKIRNDIEPINKENKKSNNLNFTFKNESVSPKKLLNVNHNTTKSRDSGLKVNQCNKETLSYNNSNSPILKGNIESFRSEPFEFYHKKTEKMDNDTSSKCFITLKNINNSFSKQIRKKMKNRKKLQKLKKMLKLQRLKIKKNSNKKPKENLSRNNNYKSFIKENISNYSICSSNNKMLSQISDITEGDISSSFINPRKFTSDLFKIELSESFEIKSSYKNVNLLSKGEMIKNIKYKKFIESLIKKQYIRYKSIDKNYKQQISLISNTTKKENINDEYIKFYEVENETSKDDVFFSDGRLISIQKKNPTNLISEGSNNLSNKKENNNYQGIQTFGNSSNSMSNKKINQKLKCSSKFLERSEKNKMNDTEIKRQEMANTKNDNIESVTFKKDLNGKILFHSYSNKIRKENNNNLNGNNTINYLKKYMDYNNKDLNSITLKNSLINKSNNYNSFSYIFDKNNNDVEKSNNCIIY